MVPVDSYTQPYSGDLPLEYLTRLDASDSYVPTVEGLQLFSDGQGFYAAEELPQWAYDIPPSDYGFHAGVAMGTDTAPASPITLPSSIQCAASSPPALDAPPPPATPYLPHLPHLPDSPMTLSDDDARALVEQYIQAAPWFAAHAHEPLVGAHGVPACAAQLAPAGESIYRCFVVLDRFKKNKPVYKCAACEYTSDRLHRVVGHQRVKRNHKPYACPDVGCEFRGPTKMDLSDHRSKRNNATWCPECREPIVIKNLSRHLQDIHGH